MKRAKNQNMKKQGARPGKIFLCNKKGVSASANQLILKLCLAIAIFFVTISFVSAARLGVGITDPSEPLHVRTASGGAAVAIEENSGDEQWELGVDSSGNLGFANSGIPAVVFKDGGNVNIMTNTLMLNGDRDSENVSIGFYDSGSGWEYIYWDDTNGLFAVTDALSVAEGFVADYIQSNTGIRALGGIYADYDTAGTDTTGIHLYGGDGTNPRDDHVYFDIANNVLRVVGGLDGNPGARWAYIDSTSGWQAGSSRDIKHNIKELKNSDYKDIRNIFDNTELYYYNRDDQPGVLELGFIAEESPDLITGSEGKTISYLKAISFLAALDKEQEARIKSLERLQNFIEFPEASLGAPGLKIDGAGNIAVTGSLSVKGEEYRPVPPGMVSMFESSCPAGWGSSPAMDDWFAGIESEAPAPDVVFCSKK